MVLLSGVWGWFFTLLCILPGCLPLVPAGYTATTLEDLHVVALSPASSLLSLWSSCKGCDVSLLTAALARGNVLSATVAFHHGGHSPNADPLTQSLWSAENPGASITLNFNGSLPIAPMATLVQPLLAVLGDEFHLPVSTLRSEWVVVDDASADSSVSTVTVHFPHEVLCIDHLRAATASFPCSRFAGLLTLINSPQLLHAHAVSLNIHITDTDFEVHFVAQYAWHGGQALVSTILTPPAPPLLVCPTAAATTLALTAHQPWQTLSAHDTPSADEEQPRPAGSALNPSSGLCAAAVSERSKGLLHDLRPPRHNHCARSHHPPHPTLLPLALQRSLWSERVIEGEVPLQELRRAYGEVAWPETQQPPPLPSTPACEPLVHAAAIEATEEVGKLHITVSCRTASQASFLALQHIYPFFLAPQHHSMETMLEVNGTFLNTTPPLWGYRYAWNSSHEEWVHTGSIAGDGLWQKTANPSSTSGWARILTAARAAGLGLRPGPSIVAYLGVSLPPHATLHIDVPVRKHLMHSADYPSDFSRSTELLPVIAYAAPVDDETVQAAVRSGSLYEVWQVVRSRGAKGASNLPQFRILGVDFSMPYNVLAIVSPLFALFYGGIINLLARARKKKAGAAVAAAAASDSVSDVDSPNGDAASSAAAAEGAAE